MADEYSSSRSGARLMNLLDLRAACSPRLAPSFLELGRAMTIPAGTVLVNFGEQPDRLYYIHSGLVCGSRILDDGKEIFAVILGQNSIFPDVFYFANIPSESQMRTLRETRVSVFDRQTIDRLMRDPQFVHFITSSLAFKGVNSANRLVSRLNDGRREKVLHLLYELAFFEGIKSADGYILHFSQEELASILGMHRVTISKILSDFQRDGIILCRRNRIRLLDSPA